MKQMISSLGNIKPKPSNILLRDLAAVSQKVQEGESLVDTLPLVRIDIADKSYQGFVAGFVESSNQNFLTLVQHDGRTSTEQSSGLTFLEFSGHVQITFLSPQSALSFFTKEAASWSNEKSFTSLETKRAVATIQSEVSTNYSVTVDYDPVFVKESGTANVAFRDLILALSEYFKTTSSDEIGKKALVSVKVVKIKFVQGRVLTVSRTNSEIILEVDLAVGLVPKKDFFKELDRLLS